MGFVSVTKWGSTDTLLKPSEGRTPRIAMACFAQHFFVLHEIFSVI
jgi:hypothetical protein